MTTEDDAWLALIRAAPHDRARRLAYADALAADDPRAELIRVEEAARALPLDSDAYWALKPRRDELRRRVDRPWRDALDYGTRQHLLSLRPWPDDWAARWRLLRELVEQWSGVRTGDIGRSCPRIAAIERAIRRPLPPSVREWVVFVDDIHRANGWWHVFRDSLSLEPMPRHRAFSLMVQGEDDRHWAVRYEELAHPDPPVDSYSLYFGDPSDIDANEEDDDADDDDGFRHDRRVAERLTDWARDFILLYHLDLAPHPDLRRAGRD